MRESHINYVSSLCSTVVNFAGLLNWKERFNQILRRGVPFPSHVCPRKFLLYPASVWWREWTAQRPRRAGPLNCLHGTQDREMGTLCLELCFPFPSAEPLMIPKAKGAFVTEGSLLWCCLRDQQRQVSLTWTFWNPVILGICFVLVLGRSQNSLHIEGRLLGWGMGELRTL